MTKTASTGEVISTSAAAIRQQAQADDSEPVTGPKDAAGQSAETISGQAAGR